MNESAFLFNSSLFDQWKRLKGSEANCSKAKGSG